MLEDEIMNYLRENPAAGDTAQGVLQWWLARPLHKTALTDVIAALENLVTEKRIEVRTLPSGELFYWCESATAGPAH